jgi:hypothetical protein
VGEARGVPAFGPVILMLREEAILRDALRTLDAVLHLHSDAYYARLEEGEEPIFAMVSSTGHYRQAIDATVSSLAHMLRWLLGEDWVPAAGELCSSLRVILKRRWASEIPNISVLVAIGVG